MQTAKERGGPRRAVLPLVSSPSSARRRRGSVVLPQIKLSFTIVQSLGSATSVQTRKKPFGTKLVSYYERRLNHGKFTESRVLELQTLGNRGLQEANSPGDSSHPATAAASAQDELLAIPCLLHYAITYYFLSLVHYTILYYAMLYYIIWWLTERSV